MGKPHKPAHPDFQWLVDNWHIWWMERFGTKPLWNSISLAHCKALVNRIPDRELITKAALFYLDQPDYYCRKNGQSFSNFYSVFDKTVSRMKAKNADSRFDDL